MDHYDGRGEGLILGPGSLHITEGPITISETKLQYRNQDLFVLVTLLMESCNGPETSLL